MVTDVRVLDRDAGAPRIIRRAARGHLDASNAPKDAHVVIAYGRLRLETDALFHAATDDRGPRGVRIVFTYCADPYTSDRELIAAVRSSRVLEITTAARSAQPLHPLLG